MEKKFEIVEQNLTEGKACSLLFTHLIIYAMCKFEFHDSVFQKMKRSNGI